MAAVIVAGLAGSVFAQGPSESEGFVNPKDQLDGLLSKAGVAAMIARPRGRPGVLEWTKGELVGQKPAFKLKEILAIRTSLQMQRRLRNWRRSIWASTGDHAAQDSTRPVQFEITRTTREAIGEILKPADRIASNARRRQPKPKGGCT